MLNWGAQKPPSGTLPNFSHPLMRGILGQWIFNEGAGMYAYDSSGYNNNGLLTGMSDPPIITSGWNLGQAGRTRVLAFDGSDMVTITKTTVLTLETKPKTLSAWVMPNGATEDGWVISTVSAGSTGYELYWSGSTDKIGCLRYGIWSDAIFTENNIWVHIVEVYDGTNVSFYKNGVLAGTPVAMTEAAGTTNLAIGNRIGGGTAAGYFKGSIDDVRIWCRALTQEEVMMLYLSSYCMFPKQDPALLYQAPAAGITANSLMFGVNF